MARNNRKQYTVISGAFLGAGVTALCYVVGAAVIACCVLNELLGQQGSGLGVLMIIVLSAAVGGWVVKSVVNEKAVLACILSDGIVLLTVLVFALLLDGPFVNAVPTTVAIGTGTILACALCMKKQKKQSRRKRSYR